MTRIIFIMLLLSSTTLNTVMAQNVAMMYSMLPDSLKTMTTKNETRIISDERLSVEAEEVRYDLLRLPVEDADSVFCLMRTIAAPEHFTIARIYNKEWAAVSDEIDFSRCEELYGSFTEKPDTMTEEQYNALVSLIEIPFVEAEISTILPYTLVLHQNVPMTSKDEKESLKAILVQRNVKWNTKRINKCKNLFILE